MVRSIRLFSDLPRIPRSFVLSARRISPNLPWRAGSLVVGSARFQKGEESHCQDDFPCPGQLKFATWRNLSVLNNDPERRARPAINPVGVPFDPGLGLLVRPGVGDSGTGHFPAQVPAPRPQERERQPATELDVPGFGPDRGGRDGVGPGGRLSGDRQACDAAIRRLRPGLDRLRRRTVPGTDLYDRLPVTGWRVRLASGFGVRGSVRVDRPAVASDGLAAIGVAGLGDWRGARARSVELPYRSRLDDSDLRRS